MFEQNCRIDCTTQTGTEVMNHTAGPFAELEDKFGPPQMGIHALNQLIN